MPLVMALRVDTHKYPHESDFKKNQMLACGRRMPGFKRQNSYCSQSSFTCPIIGLGDSMSLIITITAIKLL